jgi:hypothetical protein
MRVCAGQIKVRSIGIKILGEVQAHRLWHQLRTTCRKPQRREPRFTGSRWGNDALFPLVWANAQEGPSFLLGALVFVGRFWNDFDAAVKLLRHLIIASLHSQNFVAFVDHD